MGVGGKRCQEERWWWLDVSNGPVAFFFKFFFLAALGLHCGAQAVRFYTRALMFYLW